MKAGRPSYHVRSKWVTITTAEGVLYFELDSKGSLVRGKQNQLVPDHIARFAAAPAQPVQVPKAATPIPAEDSPADLPDSWHIGDIRRESFTGAGFGDFEDVWSIFDE
jgi:hypothetical protein